MKSSKSNSAQPQVAPTPGPKEPKSPLNAAFQIGEDCRGHFDWPNVQEVFKKVKEEITELEESFELTKKEQVHELGDVLFTLTQIARHLKIDPELALDLCNQRHGQRMQKMKELALKDHKDYQKLRLPELEKYWGAAKNELKPQEARMIEEALK